MSGAVVEVVIVIGLIVAMLVVAGFRAARRHVGGGVPASTAAMPIDRFAVGEPWRHLVGDVQHSRARFAELVAAAAPGPLRDRLTDIGTRLDDAVQECWRIAQHGHRLDRAASGMRIEVTRAELAALEAGGTSTDADGSRDARAASVRTRIESYDRITSSSRQAEAKLRLLDARLQESAARGGELALQAGAGDELDSLTGEVTAVTDELEALRQALDETGGSAG